MKNKILTLLLFGVISLSNSNAQKIQIDSLDLFIHKLMNDFEVPGLAIGIVQNDSIIYSKGFGTREINKNLPVNENTIFGIGSISKSFTALTLGILVDEGKINWGDKVKEYLPYFELNDPYVTENFTIRDLLTHRSGLKDVSGGTLWYHSDFSRIDIIKRLKYLQPVSGYREKPAYQNVMFVVAGEIVREVAGTSWDDFLNTRVFDRLSMRNSTSNSGEREANSNLANPHVWSEDFQNKVEVIQEKGDNLAAAGFIYSSANEMINYMRLLLNDGVFERDTIVREKVIDEIFTPQVLYPISGPPFGNEFSSYGFGWWLTPINGHKIIEHSGGIDGMSAQLIMVKDLDIGFVILTNVSKEPATFLLKAKLLEIILEDKSFDIYERVKGYRQNRLAENRQPSIPKIRISKTQPSLALEKYVGVYVDKMYGDIFVKQLNKELEISFSHTPIFRGKLKHWHFDTFIIDWSDARIPDGYLTFNFNSNREILGITLDQENLLDVDFGELEILKRKN